MCFNKPLAQHGQLFSSVAFVQLYNVVCKVKMLFKVVSSKKPFL